MARVFSSAEQDFENKFTAFLAEQRGETVDVAGVVRGVLDDVRERGAQAVVDYTIKFDRLELTPETLHSPQVDIEELAKACPQDVREAIRFAHDRIEHYHAKQRPSDHSFTDDAGLTLGWRWTPLSSVGIYVPGGRASYPSSVLMNAVPAKAAGVERIVMVAPAPDGQLSPAVAYAAQLAGVSEYYPIGGAQAVGALAYGAGPITPVDKIVGPGNAFVAEAKRQVFGHVGIDSVAGPSEVCIIADGSVPASWIAADLLSQAEHDPAAQSILITTDEIYGRSVQSEVSEQLNALATEETARKSWTSHGAIITVSSREEACQLSNRIAPEHLELALENSEQLIPEIRHAGAVFVGPWAPEALGDYVTGSNHVLPTSQAARYASGLGIYDFLKRMSVQSAGKDGFLALAGAAQTLAAAERLPAHARSVSIRLEETTDL